MISAKKTLFRPSSDENDDAFFGDLFNRLSYKSSIENTNLGLQVPVLTSIVLLVAYCLMIDMKQGIKLDLAVTIDTDLDL